jgi:hypothetical protein
MEPEVEYKKKKVEMQICPVCGSNHLKRHVPYWDPDEKRDIDLGIWHKYDCFEPGRYVCENDHEFRIRIDEYGVEIN